MLRSVSATKSPTLPPPSLFILFSINCQKFKQKPLKFVNVKQHERNEGAGRKTGPGPETPKVDYGKQIQLCIWCADFGSKSERQKPVISCTAAPCPPRSVHGMGCIIRLYAIA